jgi:hypothetical protein
MRKFTAVAVLTTLVLLVLGQSALATTSYPDYFGPNVAFTGIQETSTFGDPEPLFGAPTGSLNQLLFFPANFTATTAGANGFDQTGAQLQMTFTANPLNTITQVNITEFGDATLIGANLGTGVFASMAGFLTVMEVNGLPVTPLVIGFNAGGLVNGSFTPAALGGAGLNGIANPGSSLWSGTVSVDVDAELILAGYLPTDHATKVVLSFDNDLYAYTGPTGVSAKIQKKVVDGPAIIIEVIPEPGTFALLCGGLVALTLRARSRRA